MDKAAWQELDNLTPPPNGKPADVAAKPGSGGRRQDQASGKGSLEAKRLLTIDAAALSRKKIPPPRWAVDGLLPVGATCLAGKPKIRKSWMALQIGLAIASGGKALGNIDVLKGEVLYLALEDTEARLQSRLDYLMDEEPRPVSLHFAYDCPSIGKGIADTLGFWFEDHPDTRLVIVDTLAKVRTGRKRAENVYEEDYAVVSELKSIADKAGCSLLFVTHVRKMPAEDPVDAITGSYGVAGASDGILVLSRKRSESGAVLFVAGRDVEENEFRLEWAEHTAWTMMGDAKAFEQTQAEIEVLSALRTLGRPAQVREVAELIGKSRNTVKVQMFRMTNRGRIINVDGWHTVKTEQEM